LALTEMISSDAQVAPASHALPQLVISVDKPASRGVSLKIKPGALSIEPRRAVRSSVRICDLSAELCLKLLGSVRIKVTRLELRRGLGKYGNWSRVPSTAYRVGPAR
jgi:hypothetical protein